ncbi:MAG: flavin reductase-like protein 1 [Burkholderiaceae bacterium]|nr:flavin reductase-like protein 1 [Burkholderiaceae bacterium]
MSARQAVPLEKSYLLLNHGPVTLISSAHAGKQNVMAVAWTMPLDFSPPKVAVVISSAAYSRELIEASGEFVVNIPSKAMAASVLSVGSESGRDVDKFTKYAIGTQPASKVGAPLVDGCVGWLECRLIPEAHNQQHYDLLFGEIVAAWADPRVFNDGRWTFPAEEMKTIHYVAGGSFFTTGAAFEA